MFPSIPSINPLKSARRDCTMNVKSTTGLLPAKNVQHAAGDWQGLVANDWTQVKLNLTNRLCLFSSVFWSLGFQLLLIFPPWDAGITGILKATRQCQVASEPKNFDLLVHVGLEGFVTTGVDLLLGQLIVAQALKPKKKKKAKTGLKLGSLWVIWIPVRQIWY